MAVDSSLLKRNIRGTFKLNCRIDAVPSASEVESDGALLVVASTDDLLGLGSDARVKEAAQNALRKWGTGRTENTRAQVELEARAVSLFGGEAALCISHEEALLALLPAWRFATENRGRRALADAFSIASPEEAESALVSPSMAGLVIEAVHLLEGDLALVPRYAEVCQRRHSSFVVIDDALGVLGPTGGGAVEHLSAQEQVTLRVLPLGRAIPGSGALVLGNQSLIEVLRGSLPSPPAHSLAATTRALDIAGSEGARRARLFDVAHTMIAALRGFGFDTGPCVTPWIPLWLGDEALCEAWLTALADLGIATRGWLAGPRSRLLLSVPATITDGQVAQIIQAFERLSRKLQVPEGAPRNKEAPVLARPGSYALSTPAALHWTTVEPRDRRVEEAHSAPVAPSSTEELSLRNRMYDAIETMTWRASSTGGAQLRRSVEALRALLDKRPR